MPDREAVHRRDERLAELGEPGDEAAGGKAGEVARAGAACGDRQEIGDIVASGEDAAAAGKHDRADVRVALGGVEGLDQRLVHGAGDRVLLLGASEGGEENRPLARDLDPGAHIASARTDS